MSTPKMGNDFDHANIAGIEQVKESYRAALQEEPRAIIDDAIRAAARRAVSSAPMSMGKRWAARWTTPLAAAATVMLTSSVIFMAVRDRPEVAPPIAEMVVAREEIKNIPSDAAKAAKPATPAFESGAAENRTDVIASPAPVSASATPSLQLNQTKEKKLTASESVAPVAAARTQDSSNRIVPAPVLPSTTAHPVKPTPPDKPLPAAAKQFAPPAELMAKATPTAPAISALKVLNETKKEVASNLNASVASRRKVSDSEATAALTAQATGTVPQMLNSESVIPRAEISAAARQIAAAPAPDAVEKSPTISLRAASAASEKNDKIESADAWIKRMTELKRQEKNKELTEEVARFRKRYPSVELPKELIEAQN